jgi:UDP-N-acetylmuramyl pentapeptide phosphotransferase/UDP-N-acetylglucosamine-1-phosphate transferase
MSVGWLAPLAAFLVCWMTLSWLLWRGKALPLDHPNPRSLHHAPTPRIGGLGIMSGVAGASLWLGDAALLPTVLAALALATLSLLDDVRGLPVGLRLLGHLVAALGCLLALGLAGWALWLATVGVVWMTNLYNFMDGADGLAGGMAVFGFGAYALLALDGGDTVLGGACLSIAAAALAFLRFNFHPACLFMGDSGSIPLGFLAAVLGIQGWQQGHWSPLFPLLVFSPFIVDASLTLARRALAGERLWQAHRNHYYQRLVRLGWGHRKTALAEYALMLIMLLTAWVGEIGQCQAPMLVLAAMLYLAAAFWVDRRWRLKGDQPACD